MMWVLAEINTILPAQFKWAPLKSDVCMHWRVTDGDDGEWGKWVTSVDHTVRWQRVLGQSGPQLCDYFSLKASSWASTHIDWKVLCQRAAQILYKTNPQESPTPCAINKTVRKWKYKSYQWSNTVQMESQHSKEKNLLVFVFIAHHSVSCFSCFTLLLLCDSCRTALLIWTMTSVHLWSLLTKCTMLELQHECTASFPF